MQSLKRILACAAAAVVVSCSSGGGSDSTAPAGQQPTDPPVTNPVPDPNQNGGVTDERLFPVFESGQVRPLALSADAAFLYAVNTPDNRLEIFSIDGNTLTFQQSVPVGMEPVAVAVHNSGDVWVVNHLSDSISIVDTSAAQASVKRTLLVGDEPRDIVFAGAGFNRAFVTAAHRGQNAPFDPQLKTPGVSRADVWVFDVSDLGATLGGTPLTIVSMFGDTTRGLAASPDGATVYAAVLNSGNQTTTLDAVADRTGLDKPPPQQTTSGSEAPLTGLIVRFDGTDWRDNGDPTTNTESGVWTERVRFSLPDNDVFAIDAQAPMPNEIAAFTGVGTTLFNLAVNPQSGQVYVSNTQARNEVRFEGHGTTGTTVRGHLTETRITVIDGASVQPRHLNKHIQSYDEEVGTAEENALSLAQVLDMAVTDDGQRLFATGFGSSKLAVFNTAALHDNSFQPDPSQQITLAAGGPTGVVLHEASNRAYVLTRFDNGVSVIDTENLVELSHVQMFNPEPDFVVQGRPFLYDAALTSSRGDSSCASCHIFADVDHLAWDLGEPEGEIRANLREYAVQIGGQIPEFHPMKGPMTTQSLRGMLGNGPMHWRGDRTGSGRDADESLEEQAFEQFNPAFVGLLGRAQELDEAQMDLFARFALQIMYPPNPIRSLDNSLTAGQADGRNTYFNVGSTANGVFFCNDCHTLDEQRNQFGTAGLMSVEGSKVAEDFKIPHLRAAYQKVGMFGSTSLASDGGLPMGPQIRGFGFLHDGSLDTLQSFFTVPSSAGFTFTDQQALDNVIDFVFAFDSELAPIVGQQLTLAAANDGDAAVAARLQLLMERAAAISPREECDLIAHGRVGGEVRGALFNPQSGLFELDRANDGDLSAEQLSNQARQADNMITFTCVPPGQGQRMGLDRDMDGVLDGDE